MKFKINSKHQKINTNFIKNILISKLHNNISDKYIQSCSFSSFYFKDTDEYIGIYSIKRKTLTCNIYKIIKNTDSYCIIEDYPDISKEYLGEYNGLNYLFANNPVKHISNHGQICYLPNLTIEQLKISSQKTCYMFTNMTKRKEK